MTAISEGRRVTDYEALVAAAIGGDEDAFSSLAARHRRELHVHCYRMLASFEEAEDVVQETLLRAWTKRDTFSGGAGFRAWLYRIATNAATDALRRSRRQLTVLRGIDDVPWLQPYPDRLLDEVAPPGTEPEAVAVARETISLAYLATIQLLPPRQRAALLVRDVLGWSTAETAAMLDMSVAATNSALQRARTTLAMQALPGNDRPVAPTAEQRTMLAQFMDAHERADAEAALAMLRADARITMPPYPWRFDGIAMIAELLRDSFGPKSHGEWRLVATSANRMPAAASYLRRPGETEFRAFKLDVLWLDGDQVAEITTFGPELFAEFGLPATL